MTGDEPQGTMGRVQTAGEVSPVVSFPPSFARTSRETSGYEAALGSLRSPKFFVAHADFFLLPSPMRSLVPG